MEPFRLIRKTDFGGVSGVSVVANGVLFDSGKAVLCWLGKISSVVVYDSMSDLENVVCHGGNSFIEFFRNQPNKKGTDN